jgi:Na+/melibiose symporter-like transporter
MAAFGLLGMAVCQFVSAVAWDIWVLGVMLALWAPMSGLACSIAQSALVGSTPDERERRMADWTLAGTLGDLMTPAVLYGCAVLGLGWRGPFVVSGVLLVIWAGVIARKMPERVSETSGVGDEDEEEELGYFAGIRVALANRRLVGWLLAVGMCGLLDETLAAFATLFVRDNLGGDLAAQSATLLGFTAGSIAGLLVLQRIPKTVDPIGVLIWVSAGSAASYLAWLASPTTFASAALSVPVGFFTSFLYPIAMAQAYRAMPGRPGLVNAVGNVFTPIDLLAPALMGLIADRHGVLMALACLVGQPIAVGLIAIRRRLAPARRPL